MALAGALAWSAVHVLKWYRNDRTARERDSLWTVIVFAWAFWALLDNLRVHEMLDGTTRLAIWLLAVAASKAIVALLVVLLLLLPGFVVTSASRLAALAVLPIFAVVVSVGTVLLEYLLVISLHALFLG